MKKHLIALAISSAFIAPAFADVEVGPFAIYGTLQTAVEMISVTGTASKTAESQTRLMDQSSRLGFKVKHDLSEGMFALAQVESRIYLGNNGNATDDRAELGSRNTFAGIGSKTAGTVRLGRYDNAYKLALRQATPTLYGNLNDASADYGSSNILNRLGARQGDIVAYESPDWSGFSVNASYNLGKDATNSISGGSANNTAKNTVATDLMPQLAIGVGYKSGPFTVSYGTTRIQNANWKLDSSSAASAVNTQTGEQKLGADQIGAQYAMGAYSVGLVVERTTSSLSAGANAHSLAQNTYGIVGGYKAGALELQLRIASALDVEGSASTDTGANQIAIAAAYTLNKYAKLVGSVTSIDNKKNANFTSASGFSLSKGSDMTQLALGLAVSF